MSYEIINEKLGIRACGIADLTGEQVRHFLGLWEEGAKIGSLTLFYDNESGYIVLNKDNSDYNFYLNLAEVYLDSSEEERQEIDNMCKGHGAREALVVLRNCIKFRETKKQMELLSHAQYVEDEYNISHELLREIKKKYSFSSDMFCMYKAFQFGVIQGKRMERAKRNKQV